MAFVVNQKVDSGKTLTAYRALAKTKNQLVIPAVTQGGTQGPNPNPGSGFP